MPKLFVWLQSIPQHGLDPKQDPITPKEFFAALQIFEALAVDQSLPFNFINALQVQFPSMHLFMQSIQWQAVPSSRMNILSAALA